MSTAVPTPALVQEAMRWKEEWKPSVYGEARVQQINQWRHDGALAPARGATSIRTELLAPILS